MNGFLAVINVVVVLLLLWFTWRILTRLLYRQIVFDYQSAILYRNGKFQRVLEAGAHWLVGLTDHVQIVDTRTNTVTIGAQEVLTEDNVGLKISITARYKISDPVRSQSCANWYTELYALVQLAGRNVVASSKAEDLLAKRNELGKELLALVAEPAQEIGLTVEQVELKDIMFPAELRKIFNEVVRAKKEGQAALERARGEQAALRNLANAARMLENNPALMNLRILQSLASPATTGTPPTVILGMQQGLFPLRSADGQSSSPSGPAPETDE